MDFKICYLQVFVKKCRNCIPVKDLGQWDLGALLNKFKQIFFSCKRYIQLCLGPLNKLSTIFSAKMPKLCYSQNSWPIGPKCIFEQILIGLLFPCKKFSIISWTSKYAIYKFQCKKWEIVFQSKLLASGT